MHVGSSSVYSPPLPASFKIILFDNICLIFCNCICAYLYVHLVFH